MMIDREMVRQIVVEVLKSSLTSRDREGAVNPIGEKPNVDRLSPTRSSNRVVIGAEDIKRLAKSGAGIELPAGAILTPLAKDLITQLKLTVRTASSSAAGPVGATSIGLVYDEKTAAVQDVLNAAAKDALPVCVLPDWDQAVNEIRAGRLAGAVAMVREPHFALCYANKFKGIRAATAGDGPDIRRAIETINANVLVIDGEHRGIYQVRQLVRTFIDLRTGPNRPGSHQAKIEEKE